MLPYRDSHLTRTALIIFFLIVLMYGYFEARGLLFGPSITINSQTQEVHTSYTLISGHADRITSLSVDGEPIQVTVSGDFADPYILTPGLNRIVFDAKDAYNNTTEKVVEILYTPSATATVPLTVSSSSPATTSSSTRLGR